jgi:hypothetical protein
MCAIQIGTCAIRIAIFASKDAIDFLSYAAIFAYGECKMADLLVPVPYTTTADAMADTNTGNTIVLAACYGPETTTVTVNGLAISGPSSVQGTNMSIADGFTDFPLWGQTPNQCHGRS